MQQLQLYTFLLVSSPIYRRVLLKLSGEALMGEQTYGIDPAVATQIAKDVAEISAHGSGVLLRSIVAAAIRAGARLFTSLQEAAQTQQSDVIIEGVECLSVCKRPCTIAFTDQNKWAYVYGDFTADDSAEQILACASLYATTADGLIPWKERPDALKKGVIARLPASLTSSCSPETQP